MSTASLIFPSGTPDLFKSYKPSSNAHVDFLSTSGSANLKTTKTVKLSLRIQPTQPTSKDLLSLLLPSIPYILSGQTPPTSYHTLSATCHRLTLPPHSLGPTIYTKVHEELEKSVAGLAREWKGSILGREGGWLLRLSEGWAMWEKRVAMLSAIFVYLDRVYSNESTGIASIRDLAVATFKKGIWENEVLFGKTRDDILAWAAKERMDGAPDENLRPTIISIIKLSNILNQYQTIYKPYSESLIEHYTTQAELHVDGSTSTEDVGMSPTRYVEWALGRVEEERERASTCLDEKSGEMIVESVRKEVGTKMQDRIVRRALDEAMDIADAAALARLYKFTVDTKTFPVFTSSLRAYIEARLRMLISDPKNDSQMIEETLKLKRFTDKSVAALFNTPKSKPSKTTNVEEADLSMEVDQNDEKKHDNDDNDEEEIDDEKEDEDEEEKDGEDEMIVAGPVRNMQLELQDAIRIGFKAGMGSRQNAPAEWIAKHLDQVMRKGQGSGSEQAFNALLDEIIALIGFTPDKDVFKAFYSTQLAKRLLLNKSASNDMERNMIIKLQKEMGEEFTTGDVMMKDLALSETLIKTYLTNLSKGTVIPDPTNLSANVLTESAWPAYPLLKEGWSFKLTPELQSSIDEFTNWYATQHKNRMLSWRWQLATVTLTGRFGTGRYEIGVSLFQAVVLLGFNEDDELDFNTIQNRTGIETSELIRTLQSLSLGRKGTRVLLKKPLSKEVLPTDLFKYNSSFTSDRIKFKINQIQQDLSAEESKKTNEQVAVDRVSVLEATIVRIMKGKKRLFLAGLIDGVVSDVSKRFPPDVKEIKKRVESLIEREFLIRDEKDRNLLIYLA